MAKHDDGDLLLQRHEIVMRIMEVNSEQLRCDSERCGLEVELLNARSKAEDNGQPSPANDEVSVLEHRLAELKQRNKVKLEELEKLNNALARFGDTEVLNSARTAN